MQEKTSDPNAEATPVTEPPADQKDGDMPVARAKPKLPVFTVVLMVCIGVAVVGYSARLLVSRTSARHAIEEERQKAETVRHEAEQEAERLCQQLAEQKRRAEEQAATEKRRAEEQAATEKRRAEEDARRREHLARTVPCPKCGKRFEPESNKAPLLGAVLAGTGGGAAAGGAGGAYAGAGTGVAVGGVGAFPGAGIGGVIGGVAGGIIGGVSSAWYRDRQVKCPDCGKVFKNPKN